MMTTKLKSFLVLLAVMVGGVNGTWADELVGTTDNQTGYLGDYSNTEQSLTTEHKLHYEFINHSDKSDNSHNWLLCLTGLTGLDETPFVLRADNWWVCGSNNPDNKGGLASKITLFTSSIDWSHFRDDMDGAKVLMDISYLNYGSVIVVRVTATNNGRVYTETLKLSQSGGTIKARLSVNNSHLIISREEVTNLWWDWNDFTLASSLDGNKFESQNSSTDWTFESGYKNISNGWRSFSIKNLQNGDQVIITYEKTSDPNAEIGTNYDAATFTTTNAKTPTGDYVSSTTVVQSETPYTICQNGTLTLNVHRRTVIKSIEINRSTIDGGPRVVFSNVPSGSVAVGSNITEPTLTVYPAGATAYYSSDNTSVAIVDEETGEVTLVGAGTVRITATAIIGSNTPTDYYDLEVTSATVTITEYDFTGAGATCALQVASTTSSVKILDFSDIIYGSHSYGSLADRIAVGANENLGTDGARWYLNNAGIYNNLGKTGSFYILDLKNGDIVSIEYSADDLDANHHCGSSSLASTNAVTSDTWQTNTHTTNTIVYTIKENGDLKLNVGKLTHVKKITIKHEADPSFQWSDANLNPKFDTTGGGKKLRYKITDMNFREPTAVKQPSSATHTVKSLNLDVARMNPNTLGDVLFLNTGTVNIQGTMKANKIINGVETDYDHRDSYTVEVWADVATFTDTNNRYEVTGIGKLQEKEVTAVRGLKMNFGSDADATLVLRDETYNAYVAYTINKNTGWRHRNAGLQNTIPTNGSFYKFEALTSGKLKFSGVKDGEANSVVLMDASNMNGNPVFKIEDAPMGIQGTTGDGVPLTAGHTYYLFGNVPASDNDAHYWAAYTLTWFSYDSDFKLVKTIDNVETEVSYGAAPRTSNADITSVSDFVIVKGDLNPTVTIVGCSGDISSSNATVSKRDSSSCSILSVSGLSGTGGAVRFKVTSSGGGDAYYTLTIPYATHSWDFRTGTNDGENGQSRTDLATEIKTNGKDATLGLSGITRVYRSSNKNSAGVWEHISDPILAANGNVEGDNGFFIGKTSGLIFVTGAKSFGALETECEWYKPIEWNSETGQVTNTEKTTETSYNNIRGITTVDDETEYYFGPEVTTKAEYVYMKTGSKIIFPGVRPGQYIKIYTRRLSNLGDHWRAENLVDLEDKAYTSATEFTYLGINEDRNSTNNTPHAWAGDNLKGSAMFKVPTNYDASNTDISKMPSLTVTNGWVRLVKIELMDEYKTDLYLSETTKSDNKFYKVDYDSKFASVVVYKKNGVATPVEKFYQGTVGKIGSTHAHTCEYEVEKIPETLNITETRSTTGANNYNELTLTFNGGTGLVKIVQKEYGDDTGITTRADQHIINKKETYISVSEVNVQTYPYTWDFTNHNMYQGSSTTAENLAAASGSGYGSWTKQGDGNTFQMEASATINTTMQQKNISETSYEQVTKPLYAQGGQFTAGTTVVAEAEGLGISRPYGADRTQYTWATESDTFGRREYTYKTYDLTSPITIDGSALSGAGIVTIPQVENGMYVFVKANNKPSWTSTDIIDMWVGYGGNKKDPFNVANGVWLFKNIGATQDIVFTFPDNSVITTIAVTNIEKTINELGYASESRNHAIDHTYQATLTKQPVKAYAITTYDGETYNYKGYPTVKRSENALRTVPANTGIVLYQDPSDIPDDGWKDKSFVSPLFYPAVNNATPSSQDETTLASNWMAPNVESSVHTSETENRNDVECTKFVMARTFYTYSKTYGDSGDKTSSVEAFYRLRIMGNESDDRIAANKAYLLIPTAKLPVALWNNGSGEGIAGKARQGVIYFDLQELEEREAATAIKHIANESDADYRKEHTYFTMSGTRISGTPKAKGLYIREDGKKVWIK